MLENVECLALDIRVVAIDPDTRSSILHGRMKLTTSSSLPPMKLTTSASKILEFCTLSEMRGNSMTTRMANVPGSGCSARKKKATEFETSSFAGACSRQSQCLASIDTAQLQLERLGE